MTMFKSSNVGIWYCDTSWYMSKHIHEHFTGYTVTHTVYIYTYRCNNGDVLVLLETVDFAQKKCK